MRFTDFMDNPGSQVEKSVNNRVKEIQHRTDYCRLRANVGYQVVGVDDVFIINETRSFHLSGRVYPVLLPLLQQGFPLSELLQSPPAGISLSELAFAIKNLTQYRLINHFPEDDSTSNGLFWDSLGLDPARGNAHLRASTVAVLDLSGSLDLTGLCASLAKQAITVHTDQHHSATLSVVLVDDYLDPRLEAINQEFQEQKRPWLLAKPAGELIWIGPFFIPGQTACWQCLQHRIQFRRKLAGYLSAQGEVGKPPRTAQFSCVDELASALVCAEVTKFIALQGIEVLPEQLPTLNQVLTINALNYEREEHAVIQRAQCPCCGNASFMAEQQSRPIDFKQIAKVQHREGGLRQRSAQQIVDHLKHHISPVIGIIGVTNTLTLTGDEQDITTSVAAEHNFALIDSSSSFQQERIRSCSGGKGKTAIAAMAGALCESIERFSGVFQGDEKRLSARMAELPNAIHPNACLLYSEAQFQRREQHNLTASRMTWIPERFDPEQTIEWTPLWSLTHQAFYYLPTTYCFYGYARLNQCAFAKADSNGCAAGSSLAEAVLQGFLELVERDAASIWWYNRRRQPGLDLDSFNDPYLRAVEQYYIRNGMRMWVLDISSDLGVPCFVALCAKVGAPSEQITFAFGAHFDARIALVRAVSELNQIMPNVTLDANTTLKSLGVEAADWWRKVRLVDHAWLLASAEPTRKVQDYPDMRKLDLNEALQKCIDIAHQHGLNLLVLDQSRPDTGLSVVKVVVPSLRHFWPRFAPGRLYDGCDGHSEEHESQLNPWPIFI